MLGHCDSCYDDINNSFDNLLRYFEQPRDCGDAVISHWSRTASVAEPAILILQLTCRNCIFYDALAGQAD
jgi:hypothetical protein